MVKIVPALVVAAYLLTLFWLCCRFFKQISSPSFLSIDMGEEEARKIECFSDIDRRHRQRS